MDQLLIYITAAERAAAEYYTGVVVFIAPRPWGLSLHYPLHQLDAQRH